MITTILCWYNVLDFSSPSALTSSKSLSHPQGDIMRYHALSDIIRYQTKGIDDIIRYHLKNLINRLKESINSRYYKKDTSSSSSSSSSKKSYSLGTGVISYRYHITSSLHLKRVKNPIEMISPDIINFIRGV